MTTAPALKFRRSPLNSYTADGATCRYIVLRTADQKGWWTLDVYRAEETAGVRHTLGRVRIATTDCEKLAEAKAVAAEFEALGDDYSPAAHGHRERMTEAIGRAYEDENDGPGAPLLW